MSLATDSSPAADGQSQALVGVGLRHPHYAEALQEAGAIDFVEIHAENFFAPGGAIVAYAEELRKHHPISLHSVSMGLGSAAPMDQGYLDKLRALSERLEPMLISDHACFCWSTFGGNPVHAGDLLPLTRTAESLQTICDNVNRVQEFLGRTLLVENISSYLPDEHSSLTEPQFLKELAQKTGCRLLIDLNNLLVNGRNFGADDPGVAARDWLAEIPPMYIGEYHLAGHSEPAEGDLTIDDHSQPVSEDCWQLYDYALSHSGARPTLIEWDEQLPSWRELLAQADRAKSHMALATGEGNGLGASIAIPVAGGRS